MKKRKKTIARIKNSKTGKVFEIRCKSVSETETDYIVVTGQGFGKKNATLYSKKTWQLEGSPKQQIPTEEPDKPAPVEEPPDDQKDTEEIPPEIVDQIERGLLYGKSEVPTEYNVWEHKEPIDPNSPFYKAVKEGGLHAGQMAFTSMVTNTFAVQDTERRIKQSMAKRMFAETIEKRGVGFLPDGS